MTFGSIIKSGLEATVKKYLLPIGVTAAEVPLHEGLHAGIAKVLPHVSSAGVQLNSNLWYSHVLPYITFGFYKAADLPAGVGGQALTSSVNDFWGHFNSAMVAAGPEVATMALGCYWIKNSINKISKKGKALSSLVQAYCGMALIASTHYYLTLSSLHPQEGEDHYGFTQNLLSAFHLPDVLAAPLTFVGGAAMVTAALYIAKLIPSKDDNKNLNNVS